MDEQLLLFKKYIHICKKKTHICKKYSTKVFTPLIKISMKDNDFFNNHLQKFNITCTRAFAFIYVLLNLWVIACRAICISQSCRQKNRKPLSRCTAHFGRHQHLIRHAACQLTRTAFPTKPWVPVSLSSHTNRISHKALRGRSLEPSYINIINANSGITNIF